MSSRGARDGTREAQENAKGRKGNRKGVQSATNGSPRDQRAQVDAPEATKTTSIVFRNHKQNHKCL